MTGFVAMWQEPNKIAVHSWDGRDIIATCDAWLQDQGIEHSWSTRVNREGYWFNSETDCNAFLLQFGHWFQKVIVQ